MLKNGIIIYTILISFIRCFDERSEVIIERRGHHVEWDDLFMEYNRYSAPNQEKQQVNVTIDFIYLENQLVIMEMVQKWKDDRLRFIGNSQVSVPSHVQPWEPDSYIRNGFDIKIDQKSLNLDFDGTFSLKQRYHFTAEIGNNIQSMIIISSFNNFGTNLINYSLVGCSAPNHLCSSKHVARHFDGIIFQDLCINISPRNSFTNSTSF